LQPFYDVFKLFKKERIVVNKLQNFTINLYLIFMIFTCVLFFLGLDILVVIFGLTLADIFFVLAGFSVNSPYSHIGAERELLQMISYDPMILILAIGLYIVTGSFRIDEILLYQHPLILYMPGIFLGFVFVLTIKFRKSPFDLSTSHHAHQELVKGITTEFSGITLAIIEITHWYEQVMLLGFVYLFFAFNTYLAFGMVGAVYLLEILIDNTNARVKWEKMLGGSWLITLVAGVTNIIILYFILPKK
jgi:ech hydrogenase subunit B